MCALQVALSIALLGQAADKKASLEAMQNRIDTTHVSLSRADEASTKDQSAKLVEKPIFRYSDELRSIEDAAIWLWTDHNRPVAAMKVERYQAELVKVPWLYCFASLSSELVAAEWKDARAYRAKKPGVSWRELNDKPAAARRSRLLQMREMARRFAAELVKDDDGKERIQMRMLAQPLYRCEESDDVLDGAIFGFTGTGTNPDLLLLFDLPRKGTWRFGATGMTADGLRMELAGKVVYECSSTAGKGNVFDTWCNFWPDK